MNLDKSEKKKCYVFSWWPRMNHYWFKGKKWKKKGVEKKNHYEKNRVSFYIDKWGRSESLFVCYVKWFHNVGHRNRRCWRHLAEVDYFICTWKEILTIKVILLRNVIYAMKFSSFFHFENLSSLCNISFPPQFIESCNFLCVVKANHFGFCDENLEVLNVTFSLAQKLNCKSFPCIRISL